MGKGERANVRQNTGDRRGEPNGTRGEDKERRVPPPDMELFLPPDMEQFGHEILPIGWSYLQLSRGAQHQRHELPLQPG